MNENIFHDYENKIICSFKKKFFSPDELLCFLMCVSMVWPYFFARTRTLFFVGCFLLWLCCVFPRWKFKKKSKDVFFLFAFFASFFPYIVLDSFDYGNFGGFNAFVDLSLYFSGAVLADYYVYQKRSLEFLKKLLVICLFFHILGIIQTCQGHFLYLWPSRALTYGYTPSDIRSLYLMSGIGGFGFIYSLSIISPLIVYVFAKDLVHGIFQRCLLFFVLILYCTTLILASFAISVLLFLIALIIVFIIEKPILAGVVFIFFILSAGFLFFAFDRFIDFFEWNPTLQSKLFDLQMLWEYGESTETSYRFYLYKKSLLIFFEEPLFGAIYGPFGNPLKNIGEHSGWLDMLAFYGLYSFSPLALFVYYNFKKAFFFFKKKQSASFILSLLVVFLLMGLLNPIHIGYQIGFFAFFITPATLFVFSNSTSRIVYPDPVL